MTQGQYLCMKTHDSENSEVPQSTIPNSKKLKNDTVYVCDVTLKTVKKFIIMIIECMKKKNIKMLF